MNNDIKRLCDAVEQTAGLHVATPYDFDKLSSIIFGRMRSPVSSSTLKRLWGYAGQETNPRATTLDALAQFVGYKDFRTFLDSTPGNTGVQSQMFLSGTIQASELSVGCQLQLSWLPDRVCVIEHLGEGQFKVVEQKNSKLSKGDTFTCQLFISHEPLYVTNLVHQGMPPVSYVAGRRDGITIIQKKKVLCG